MFEHYLAVSYYEQYELESNGELVQSVKFKFSVYNILSKTLFAERDKSMDEPALDIKYLAPNQLILMMPSSIVAYILKN